MTRILFSPIGDTDPIRSGHDGPMLHICRKFKPDMVHLFLSKEMLKKERLDHRYTQNLKRLGEKLGHEFSTNLIEYPSLENVHDFNTMYPIFKEKIDTICRDSSKEDEIYLNVSSGTPQMISALVTIAQIYSRPLIPIQVGSPSKSSNQSKPDGSRYNDSWEDDQDNLEHYEDRCINVNCLYMDAMIKKGIIRNLIHSYNYPAALEVAKKIEETLPNEISLESLTAIEVAKLRCELDQESIDELLKENPIPYDIYPVKKEDDKELAEYVLSLALCIEKEKQDLVGFIRGISPIMLDLFVRIVERNCQVDLEKCTFTDRKKVMRWDDKKLGKYANGRVKGILRKYMKKYTNGFRDNPVSSDSLIPIIKSDLFKGKDRLQINAEKLRVVERRIRNVAAHEIISVTEPWIQKKVGMSSDEILNMIKELCEDLHVVPNKEVWNSYKEMNEYIIETLQI